MRAHSCTGNVFNVSAEGAGGPSANLANLQSTQLAGQVLNVDALALTAGKAIAIRSGLSCPGW